jgi:NAD+ synthase
MNYQKLVGWIKDQVIQAGCDGVVFGLSGGVDSSVIGVLAKQAFHDNSLGLIMPCNSNPQDRTDALSVAEKFDIDYRVVDLTPVYSLLADTLQTAEPANKIALANLKPRLRMTVLYYFANCRNSLVVGSSNRSELELGYFTKYGDGGVDIAPIGNLVKAEVRMLAKALGIPEPIIEKPPSAGLWEGQEDEKEMGLTYKEIDSFLLSGQASHQTQAMIKIMAEKNAHKRKMPVVPPAGIHLN